MSDARERQTHTHTDRHKRWRWLNVLGFTSDPRVFMDLAEAKLGSCHLLGIFDLVTAG